MSDCIFCKIVNGEVPARKEYEDESVLVFDDIHQKAPIHFLIIPKEHIEMFADLQDMQIWGKMSQVAKDLIEKHGLLEKGYRLINNGGPAATVGHLHLQLLGGVSAED